MAGLKIEPEIRKKSHALTRRDRPKVAAMYSSVAVSIRVPPPVRLICASGYVAAWTASMPMSRKEVVPKYSPAWHVGQWEWGRDERAHGERTAMTNSFRRLSILSV